MHKDNGASSGEDRATAAEPVVSALRDGIPSAVARIILRRLDDSQRDFIMRMKPHRRMQTIGKRDFDNVEPSVDFDSDGWPDVYWFGGMRARYGAGAPRRPYSFMFNEVGLEVREILLKRARSAPLVAQAIETRRAETGIGSVHESAVAESEAPND